MSVLWNRVTIIGCGLIGASFALALRRAGACEQIAGWDVSRSVLAEAVAAGMIDEVDQAFDGDSVSGSDLIYLAMPVGEIIEFLRERAAQVKPGAVITDAGSTKVEICGAARSHLKGNQQFVGGHPVAGSHLQGLAHARSDLFADSPYVLVTDEGMNADHAHRAVKETLELLGANVRTMAAVEHDRAMALVSHVPQIVSSALAAVTKDQSDAAALASLSGAGYRDMTRLASSSWSIWGDILTTNSSETAAALNGLLEKLTAVRDELRDHQDRKGKLNLTRRMFDEPGRRKAVAPSKETNNASYSDS
jgi:prephenate dehydrogenase